jgi:hypothetical protein
MLNNIEVFCPYCGNVVMENLIPVGEQGTTKCSICGKGFFVEKFIRYSSSEMENKSESGFKDRFFCLKLDEGYIRNFDLKKEKIDIDLNNASRLITNAKFFNESLLVPMKKVVEILNYLNKGKHVRIVEIKHTEI